MTIITLGVDVGQKVDPTAIAVAEQQMRPRPGVAGRQDEHYIIRHLERLALGTPYPKVADRLKEVLEGVRAQSQSIQAPAMYVDATGVGLPVVDVLRGMLQGVRIVPVYFTHGDRRTVEDTGNGKEIKLGKAWLVSRLQALLQTGRLHLPNTAEARALADELQTYEIRVDERANDTYGAFKTGAHDDLVTALGLAVQEAASPPQSAVASRTTTVTMGRLFPGAPGNPFRHMGDGRPGRRGNGE